jgi:hypothetical protein
MALTGRYDFKGIQKAGLVAVFAALATQPSTAWMTRGLAGSIVRKLLELALNFLANKGLILLNTGADFVKTKFEQSAFDRAMENALTKLQARQGVLSEEEKKEIDDAVMASFRKFAPF